MFTTGIDERYARDFLLRIEAWRDRRMADERPLADGTLEGAGPFDEKSTIARACKVSKSRISAERLYSHVLLSGATRCVEIGTNIGISSAYIAAAMAARSPDWRVETIEGSPYRLRLAREMHADLGIEERIGYHQGLFYDTLPRVLDGLDRPVELAFVDGQHQHRPTLDFFDMIFERSAKSALFVFDDIEWSDGMREAWAEIQADRRVKFSTAISAVGFVVTRRDD